MARARALRLEGRFAQLTAFFLAQTAIGFLSYQVVLPPLGAPAFWLTNGLAIGVLVRHPRRAWGALLATVVAANAFIFAFKGFPVPATVLWTLADTLEVVLASVLIQGFCGRETTLSRVRDVFVVAGSVVFAPVLAGLVAIGAVPWLGEGSSSRELFLSWIVTDGLGSLVSAPLLLSWRGRTGTRPMARELTSLLATVLAVVGIFLFVFSLHDETLRALGLIFTTFPLLGWVGLRHGPFGAAVGVTLVGAVALVQTLNGHGPFVGAASLQYEILAVHGFVALASSTALVLAAVAEERRRAERSRNLLLHAATALSEPAPLPERLRRLVEGLVPELGPAAALALHSDHDPEVTAVAAPDSPRAEPLRALATAEQAGPDPGANVFPLQAGPRPLGRLVVATQRPGGDPDDRALGGAIADRIASTLEAERARLESQGHLRAVEESLALLDTALRSAPVGLSFIGRDLRYLRVNETLARLNGAPPEAHRGKPFGVYLPQIRDVLVPVIEEVLRTGRPVTELEFSPELPSGRRHLLVSYYPVQVGAGPPVAVGGVVLDITARKEAEAERARLLEEAQESIRVRDDFLSVASHELKTPLTPLTLRLQALERRLAEGQRVEVADVARARASLERLTALINDLLDVSRVQAHRLAVRRTPLSVTRLLRETIGAAGSAAAGHPIVFEAPEEELWALGDRSRLEQVFTNLLDNALKYSPEGGPVRVVVAEAEDEVHVSVEDQGIGIPRQQQERLFDRFFRASNASARSYGGLGLGLYISRDIVEHHGGRIWVESEIGHGSIFHVALPRLPYRPPEREAPAAERGPSPATAGA